MCASEGISKQNGYTMEQSKAECKIRIKMPLKVLRKHIKKTIFIYERILASVYSSHAYTACVVRLILTKPIDDYNSNIIAVAAHISSCLRICHSQYSFLPFIFHFASLSLANLPLINEVNIVSSWSLSHSIAISFRFLLYVSVFLNYYIYDMLSIRCFFPI